MASSSELSSSSLSSQLTVGRAPWYTDSGAMKKPFLIGVTGGTASGKTTVCDKVIERLNLPWVLLLSQDRFYRPLTAAERADVANYNFDHPNAFDWPLLLGALNELLTSRCVHAPRYDFSSHSRESVTDTFYGADVVIFEGILALYHEDVRKLMDLKVFVDTDDDVRLARRLRRDVAERGRSVEGVLNQYLKTVKPAFDQFIYPSRRYADIIIPRGGDNEVAINILVEHIQNMLHKRTAEWRDQRALNNIRQLALLSHTNDEKSDWSAAALAKMAQPNQLPPNVRLLAPSAIVQNLHTIIRDKNTRTDDFQFHVNRLARLVIAEAMNELTYTPVDIHTAANGHFSGVRLSDSFVAVSIVRGGEALEGAVRELESDVAIGKIVIQQSAAREDGCRLYYCKLPQSVSTVQKVFLLEGSLATGNALQMAVRVLLDHDVKEENILVLSLLASIQGILLALRRYPKVKIVTSWIDSALDDRMFLDPGCGSIGNRFFGTE